MPSATRAARSTAPSAPRNKERFSIVQAAALAKEALKTRVPVRTLLLERGILTAEEIEKIMDAFNMTKPGIPGKE